MRIYLGSLGGVGCATFSKCVNSRIYVNSRGPPEFATMAKPCASRSPGRARLIQDCQDCSPSISPVPATSHQSSKQLCRTPDKRRVRPCCHYRQNKNKSPGLPRELESCVDPHRPQNKRRCRCRFGNRGNSSNMPYWGLVAPHIEEHYTNTRRPSFLRLPR